MASGKAALESRYGSWTKSCMTHYKGIYHNSHSLGSLGSCRIFSINSTLSLELLEPQRASKHSLSLSRLASPKSHRALDDRKDMQAHTGPEPHRAGLQSGFQDFTLTLLLIKVASRRIGPLALNPSPWFSSRYVK